jgi:hypothetical protein
MRIPHRAVKFVSKASPSRLPFMKFAGMTYITVRGIAITYYNTDSDYVPLTTRERNTEA